MFWSGASFDEENLNPEQENSKMLLLRTHPLKRSTPKT
jgi:hypothetical protein